MDKIFFWHCNEITRNHWNPFCQNGLKKFCPKELSSRSEQGKFCQVELFSRSELGKFCPRGHACRIGRGKFCPVELSCHRRRIYQSLRQKLRRWAEPRCWQYRWRQGYKPKHDSLWRQGALPSVFTPWKTVSKRCIWDIYTSLNWSK